MIPLNISLEHDNGSTTLSNVFIDRYMKEANEAEIKVYLYLLRMVGAGLPTDISEIADKFNHTEKEVIKSLKFWEKQQLICLDYDEHSNISGVTFKTPSDRRFKNADKNAESNHTVSLADTDVAPRKQEMTLIKMDYEKEKASYSLDDIKALKSNPEVSMLLTATEMYVGRPLNSSETKTLLFIYDRLAFSLDLTDYLVEFCAERNKKSIRYIEQVAINWYEEGIDSIEKAKKSVKSSDKTAYSIMKLLGKSGNITALESSFIAKWTGTYGFDISVIEEACNRTVMKTDTNRFAYADSILTSWFEKNIRTIEDIDEADKSYEKNRSLNAKTKSSRDNVKTAKNDFCKIEKSDYDFDELERFALMK